MTRAKSPLVPARFPHLRQFVGGYLHQDFAYGSGDNALRWKYGAFAMGQALGQVRHQVMTAGAHQAPDRVDR